MFTIGDKTRFLERMLVANIGCYGCTMDPLSCKHYDDVFDQSIHHSADDCVQYIIMMEKCKYKRTAEQFMDYRLSQWIAYHQHLIRIEKGEARFLTRMFDL
jgi:hypothetical protein